MSDTGAGGAAGSDSAASGNGSEGNSAINSDLRFFILLLPACHWTVDDSGLLLCCHHTATASLHRSADGCEHHAVQHLVIRIAWADGPFIHGNSARAGGCDVGFRRQMRGEHGVALLVMPKDRKSTRLNSSHQ